MSDLGVGGLRGSSHRTRHKQGRGCLAAMIALAVIAAIGVFAYVKGVDLIKDALSGPADYSGDGHKPAVTVKVADGDSGSDIAATLAKADIVKSRQAFVEAYNADPDATSIKPGRYRLESRMSGDSAVQALLDPGSLIKSPTLTIPEGLRAKEILALIVKQTSFTNKQVQAAYADTTSLGLPAYADDDPEGYLFPSTYDLEPKMTAADLLRAMVEKFGQQAEDLGLEAAGKQLGYSPHDIVTIASLVQAEAGVADMTRVSSVVYNRLAEPMRLEFDSTLHYAVDSRGEVLAGKELREIDSPYNTYTHDGLPPTPIDSPSAEALEAALKPAATNYLYFVTVDLATKETRFTDSYQEHLRNVAQYRQYCETSDEC